MTAQLEAGTVLARSYRLLRPIGEGGMARVWVAEHIQLAREVAIKVISEEALLTPVSRQLFEREAKATAKVDSPHVVRVLDFDFTDDGFPFLVLERLIGETLEERIARKGALSLRDTATLVDQIGHAVAAAHACGILHRDIKAENIFLVETKDGSINSRLLDFGVAIWKSSQPLVHGTVGTIPYMSPEQLIAAEMDERSDVFSLAICVYYALTGQLPFTGDTLVEMAASLTRRCASALEYRPDLPHAVDAWFTRALARDPAARFASADEACIAFQEALERRTPLVAEVDVQEEEIVAAGVPRHSIMWWIGAGAVAAAVALASMHPKEVRSSLHAAQASAHRVSATLSADEPASVVRAVNAIEIGSRVSTAQAAQDREVDAAIVAPKPHAQSPSPTPTQSQSPTPSQSQSPTQNPTQSPPPPPPPETNGTDTSADTGTTGFGTRE